MTSSWFFLSTLNIPLRHTHDEQYRQYQYKPNIEARSRNHFYREKAISIIYSECLFIALVTQHAQRMRRIILSTVACMGIPQYLISGTIFEKKKKKL